MAYDEIGDCPQPNCTNKNLPLSHIEPTEPDSALACAVCIRKYAKTVQRFTPCDECGAPFAWRNPKHRKNIYLCGNHHASSGDGVVLNKWFPRVSLPLNDRRPKCELANNTAGTKCLGEVKWRSGNLNMNLCNRHAGKKYKPAYEGEEVES